MKQPFLVNFTGDANSTEANSLYFEGELAFCGLPASSVPKFGSFLLLLCRVSAPVTSNLTFMNRMSGLPSLAGGGVGNPHQYIDCSIVLRCILDCGLYNQIRFQSAPNPKIG